MGLYAECYETENGLMEIALSDAKTAAALGRPVDADGLIDLAERALQEAADLRDECAMLEAQFDTEVEEKVKDLRERLEAEREFLHDAVSRRLESLGFLTDSFARNSKAKAVAALAHEISIWRAETAKLLDPRD